MVHFSYMTTIAFAVSVLALPSPLTPDPAGAKNVGNGAGGQFIGGACLSAADCASTCCATLNGAGICSGVGAQFQAGKQGCGFGGAASSSVATAAPPAAASMSSVTEGAAEAGSSSSSDAVDTSAPGSQNVGKGDGSQFITGQCFSDADCASGCCAKPKGVCSAVAVAFDSGKQGCGFTAA